jgi:coenzyme F420-reducing hydrogenase beta subunit
MPLPEAPKVSPSEVVGAGLCIGCGSCVSGSGAAGREMRWDRYGQLKPEGPRDWYRERSAELAERCPFSPYARDEDVLAEQLYPAARHSDKRVGRFEAAYVGHAEEDGFRAAGSSGGLVSWAATELLRTGLVDGVAHVAPADPQAEDRLFGYRISRTVEDVRQSAKSRYYPIELSAVLDEIRTTPGRYAVVGVPCFIKAVQLARTAEPLLAERIAFTIGLFCGHMKSARMVDSFALQMGAEPGAVQAVDFRLKDTRRPANWYRTQLVLADRSTAEQDWWHLVEGDWGSGFFQNSACNFCDDVVAETADIALGDAWVEPYSSDGRGTNVVVVRSARVHAMIEHAVAAGRLALSPVDTEFVVKTQAAGFRQRREGLAYRLGKRGGARLRPYTRFPDAAANLPLRRRAIYRMRAAITAWSHRLFRLGQRVGVPNLYFRTGRLLLGIYQGLSYGRGRSGAVFDRLERILGGAPKQSGSPVSGGTEA